MSHQFDKYTSYLDSDVPWIGEMPLHWEKRRIKELFDVSRGRVIPLTDLVENGKYPVYSSQTKNFGCLGHIDTYDYNGDYITWTTDGAYAGTVFLRTGKFNCTNICGTLRLTSKECSIEYLAYALQVGAKHNKRIDTNGAKIMSNEMKFITIMVPPLREQEIIASYLDTQTSKIDKKIDLLRKKTERYVDLKQSLITETVTNGLDKSVPMKDSGVKWIGVIPKHWEFIRTKNIFDERGQLSSTGEETLLTVSHLTGVTPRSEKNVNMFMAESMVGYKLCKEGDLIINTMWAWMGALGTSRYSGICSPAYNVYFPRKGVPYCYRYFDYLFRTRNFIIEMTRKSRGIVSSRLRLYPKDFYQIQTLLPPEKEQEKIADYLDEKIGEIDKIIGVINFQVEKLSELRKTLINDVVTGKIKVA